MKIPAPPPSTECFACQSRALSGDVAFVAGIAFAGQYNGEAVMSRICAEHREKLQCGHARTKDLVKPGQGRLDGDGDS